MIASGKLFTTALIMSLLVFSCQNKSSHPNQNDDNHLGEVDFKVTGSEEAQPKFKEGLLLLHSFEYADAREVFLEVQEMDPEMVMAYWGEAMSYNHSLWSEQDFEKGVDALNKIAEDPGERVNQAVTEIEKDFMRAINLLYQEKKAKKERDKEYSDFMAELYEKHKGNHEIAAFYALSLLGSAPEGRDYRVFEKGAKIAEGILEENASHPGALHYLIHSYDDPDHAPMALKAADNYSQVAPDASHALHMPSHIYVAMGMWDQVVASNENSYQASLNRMERKNLGNDARGYHAYHWLLYGYLQQGRTDDALKMIEDMKTYVAETPSSRARTHLVYLKTTFLAETGDWGHEVANIEINTEGLNISTQAQDLFAAGMLAYSKEDKEGMTEVMDRMFEKIETEKKSLGDAGMTVCGSASRRTASQRDINQANTMLLELKAMRANLDDDKENEAHYLTQAVDLEEETAYMYGPPDIVKPSHEMYAEWLIANDRSEEALEFFEKQLKRAPNRTTTLKGQLKAADAVGNEELVKTVEAAIGANLKEVTS